MKRSAFIAFLALLPWTLLFSMDGLALQFDTQRVNDLEIKKRDDGAYDIVTTGSDPYIFTRPLEKSYDESKVSVFQMDFFTLKRIEGLQVFFAPPLKEASSVKTSVDSSESWGTLSLQLNQSTNWGGGKKEFRIDFGNKVGQTFQIRNPLLRAMTKEELKRASASRKKAQEEKNFGVELRNYFGSTFPNKVESVVAEEENITITLSSRFPLTLAEIRPWQYTQKISFKEELLWTREMEKGRHTVKVPRVDDRGEYPYDRLYSKWCLFEVSGSAVTLASHARYCTDDSRTALKTIPVPEPKTKKGLQINWRLKEMGQLDELGIEHAAVNLFSGTFLRVSKNTPTIEHTYMGRKFFLNKNAVDTQSKLLRFAAKRKILIGGILLMEKNPPEAYRAMLHPDYHPKGIYSMANVTNEEGVFLYAMLVDFLSSYFSNERNGYIHYWVIHNEVDAAWVWTNCGRRGPDTMMDYYVKSMRLVHHTVRKYNPRAFTAISLTHYWKKKNQHGPPDTMYAPRHLLDILVDHSEKEGNFNWGLAYHPYPHDLRNPRVWEDPVDFSFDTDIISYKNLEVLAAYMKQDRFLYEGKLRPIYLTEQGLSNPNDSPGQLEIQAAAMAYAMKKVNAIDGIKAHILHRWVDHAKEGGLNLGLVQKKKGTIDVAGKKKPSFDVYASFGTPREEEATRFAHDIIGIKSWDEIMYKGKIE